MTEQSTWTNRIIGSGSEAPEQLLANPRNFRRHPAHQQNALKGVLVQVGWVQDVVVNQRTGFLVDGHLRVELAMREGQTEIPVKYVDLSPEDEALVLATLDPIGALATADSDALAALLEDVTTQDESLLAMLEDLREENGIGLGAGGGLTDPDDVPEPPEGLVTKPGDLWILGGHRLLCGDCTDEAAVRRLIAENAPTLLVTDPPYGVELDMEWRDRAGHNEMAPAERSYMKRAMGGKGISGDTKADWSAAFALVPSLKVAYVWHATSHMLEVASGLVAIGFDLRQQIVWVKTVAAMSRSAYHWKHEPCWYAVRKGATAGWIGGHDQTTVWEAASPKHIMSGSKEEKFDHPTQKPVELMTRSIGNHDGDVYEPFGGSGTTMIAAEMLGRRCCVMEVEPRYCDIIVTRWENFTGNQASLERREDAA